MLHRQHVPRSVVFVVASEAFDRAAVVQSYAPGSVVVLQECLMHSSRSLAEPIMRVVAVVAPCRYGDAAHERVGTFLRIICDTHDVSDGVVHVANALKGAAGADRRLTGSSQSAWIVLPLQSR